MKKNPAPKRLTTEELAEQKANALIPEAAKNPANAFKFIQVDRSIHDSKFQTKPTTFWKDALKRFVKNRSSVVASILIGLIFGMAIIVPIVDQNNIDSATAEAALLPAKWYGFENAGFLDGCVNYDSQTLNRNTGWPALDSDGNVVFKDNAIRGGLSGIKTNEGYTTVKTRYGAGGTLIYRTDTDNLDAGCSSPSFTFNTADTLSFKVDFNEEREAASLATAPEYGFYLMADFDSSSAFATSIPLAENLKTCTDYEVADMAGVVKTDSAYIAAGSPATFAAKFQFRLKTNQDSLHRPTIYLQGVSLTDGTDATVNTLLQKISWSESNELMLREDSTYIDPDTGAKTDNADYQYHWKIDYGSGARTLENVEILQGSFRYDVYEAAFGDIKNVDIGKSDISAYIDKGWCSFDFDKMDILVADLKIKLAKGTITQEEYDAGVKAGCESNFVLLDSAHCPVRSIYYYSSKKYVGIDPVYHLTCTISEYRLLGFTSMPYYFFGTTDNGQDYFKKAFAGLRTSFFLGIFTAVINIAIGLVWGSISGYFGGWTDILMERFTEILGGLPWIVIMTLCILHLGSNFGTFMLALCLTGWIGVSAETRSQFYRFKGREYVLASRTLGASDARLIFRHILPNGIGTIVTGCVLMIPSVIYDEATISYLKLGLQGLPSFGVTLSESQSYLGTHPNLIISGTLIMSVLLISFNLFGNGLRDAFNPSLKGVDE
jgi:oligopeptide transport system permease protein